VRARPLPSPGRPRPPSARGRVPSVLAPSRRRRSAGPPGLGAAVVLSAVLAGPTAVAAPAVRLLAPAEAEGLRVELGLPPPDPEHGPRDLVVAIELELDGETLRFGWADQGPGGCGAEAPYLGFFLALGAGACTPLTVPEGASGARHRLELRRDADRLRFRVDGHEVGDFGLPASDRSPEGGAPVAAAPIGPPRLVVALARLPRAPLGPIWIDELELARGAPPGGGTASARWQRLLRPSVEARPPCLATPVRRGARLRIDCEAAFGTRLATSDREVCAVGDDGRVHCATPGAAIGALLGLDDAVEVALGRGFGCARRAGGEVRCWGENGRGQLGDGTREARPAPVPVLGLDDAVGLAAGDHHVCARRAAGGVVCWGRNDRGQLGDGGTEDRDRPVAVLGLEAGPGTRRGRGGASIEALAAGGARSCALIGGRPRCWGAGYDPAEPRGVVRTRPVEIPGVEDATGLTVGVEHACARRVGGSVSCWGRRIGDVERTRLPSRRAGLRTVPGLSGVEVVVAGRLHGCALVAGRVWCWGYNRSGQLGDGGAEARGRPERIEGLEGVVALAAGRDHACARTASGETWCWGGRFPRKGAPPETWSHRPRRVGLGR
jgi:hypothetical protein